MKEKRILPERELIRTIAAEEGGTGEWGREGHPLPQTVEESFEELEQLLDKLEDEESSLEDSFRYFERGMELVRDCSAKIDKVEKKMIILQDTLQEARMASLGGPDREESEEEEDDGL